MSEFQEPVPELLEPSVSLSASAEPQPDAVSCEDSEEALKAALDKAFMPFIRFEDRNPWTLGRRLRTALFAVTLFPIRLLLTALCACVAWLLAASFTLSYDLPLATASLRQVFDRKLTGFEKWCLKGIRFCNRFGVAFGGFSVTRRKLRYSDIAEWWQRPDASGRLQREEEYNREPQCHAVVCNHLGYFDIFIVASLFGASFISRDFIRRVPLFGTILTAFNSLFVDDSKAVSECVRERMHLTNLWHSKHACLGCLLCECPLAVFAEGTTTNGRAMLAFRRGGFLAGACVRPIVCRTQFTEWNPSWESHEFWTHLFYTYVQIINKVTVTELPPYIPTDAERNDPLLFASNVQSLMSTVSALPIVLSNRKAKFKGYHSYLLGKVSAKDALRVAKDATDLDPVLQYFRSKIND